MTSPDMESKSRRKQMLFVVLLLISVLSVSCGKKDIPGPSTRVSVPEVQALDVKQANELIAQNAGDANFVVLDVRTLELSLIHI